MRACQAVSVWFALCSSLSDFRCRLETCSLWMVPPLAALSAPSAAAVMGFRGRTLDMAKCNAGLYGFQGAHYPWETAPNDGTYT